MTVRFPREEAIPVPEIREERGERLDAGIRLYLSRLYSAALQLTCGPAAAEDLVLRAFALASSCAGPQDAGVKAWLFRALVAASSGGHPEPPDDAGEAACARSCRPALAGEDGALEALPGSSVRNALRSLPGQDRITVYLADAEGFTYEEIAGITGTTVAIVMSRLRRGRCLLRDVLRGYAAAGEAAS